LNKLWVATAILLLPAISINVILVVSFIRTIRKTNVRLNRWLIVTTVAGLVTGVAALIWS
jgi:hypothetical protein